VTIETLFTRFWRELDAVLDDNFETPARFAEVWPRYFSGAYDMDTAVEDILRCRIAAANYDFALESAKAA
jgi:hypothetical protein